MIKANIASTAIRRKRIVCGVVRWNLCAKNPPSQPTNNNTWRWSSVSRVTIISGGLCRSQTAGGEVGRRGLLKDAVGRDERERASVANWNKWGLICITAHSAVLLPAHFISGQRQRAFIAVTTLWSFAVIVTASRETCPRTERNRHEALGSIERVSKELCPGTADHFRPLLLAAHGGASTSRIKV